MIKLIAWAIVTYILIHALVIFGSITYDIGHWIQRRIQLRNEIRAARRRQVKS